MKPAFEVVPDQADHSFIIKLVDRPSRPRLSQAWHYHPEIEICFTIESSGKKFVGNQISDYNSLDLVMFGSNLPHGYTTDSHCRQVVIQMTEDFLGDKFISKPELFNIRALFRRANKGLEFGQSTISKAEPIIQSIIYAEGFKQLIYLFELLDLLKNATDVQEICKEDHTTDFTTSNLERIRVVYDYIMENLHNEIRVKTVAEMINITEAGFYKFFKKHANKTFTEVVNEFRINHAGKLLISSNKTIANVAVECGYNNVSYFNRTFKKMMNKTPRTFREAYSESTNFHSRA